MRRFCFWILILDKYVAFISQLNSFSLSGYSCELGGKYTKQIAEKDRKELEAKLANVFDEEINSLSTELREILLDDMVTAFENRLNVLNNATRKSVN